MRRTLALLVVLSCCVPVLTAACGDGSTSPADAGVALPWPAAPPAMTQVAPLRGRAWSRGIIHAHSIYSHDACDGNPYDDAGNPNLECLAQLRAAMCADREDWFMLTDHKASMATVDDWATLLLFDAAAGDVLVERDGAPIANRLACSGGGSVLLMQGHEDDLMPIGMEKHVAGTAEERDTFYGRRDAEAVAIYRDQLGALVMQNHTEQYTVDDLATLGLDGVEVFNAHAALLPSLRKDYLQVDPTGGVNGTVAFFDFNPSTWNTAPEADLSLLGFLEDFAVYNQNWDGLLARGRMTGILGTDVHQNSFPLVLRDGERGDSYRRMIRWYSNWLLMADAELTPDTLKDAIRQGRLAGVFEVIGTPVGLDFHAEVDGTIYEVGDEVELASAPTLVALAPTVMGLDPQQTPPDVALSLKCGGVEIATGTERIDYTPTATGACRLDVTIVPRHLEPFLGTVPELAAKTYPWVKVNPIYVK
jgi:hypothetical protein